MNQYKLFGGFFHFDAAIKKKIEILRNVLITWYRNKWQQNDFVEINLNTKEKELR